MTEGNKATLDITSKILLIVVGAIVTAVSGISATKINQVDDMRTAVARIEERLISLGHATTAQNAMTLDHSKRLQAVEIQQDRTQNAVQRLEHVVQRIERGNRQ